MANKKDAQEIKKDKDLAMMSNLYSDVLDKITNIMGDDSNRKSELDFMSKIMTNLTTDDYGEISSTAGDDITTFLYKSIKGEDKVDKDMMKNIEDIFTNKNESLANLMFDKKASKNIVLEDLQLVCSYLYQLQEAVNATRDAVVTSDDIGVQISRNLLFRNSTDDSDELKNIVSQIENMEDELKLHHKIKNHIIPKTLSLGSYYVYSVPYNRLITDYKSRQDAAQRGVSNNSNYFMTLKESTDLTDFITGYSGLMEDKQSTIKVAKEASDEYLSDIEICNESSCVLDDVVNVEEIIALEGTTHQFAVTNDAINKQTRDMMKGKFTYSANESIIDEDKSSKNDDYSSVTGCYIKLIDPRRLVEVKVLDKVIGYYYLIDTGIKVNKMPFSSSMRFNMNIATSIKPEDLESDFVHVLADRIVKSMDKKYLENNPKFKDVIVNALLFDDIYKRKIRFQFIPVDYITKFAIDEDLDGEGTSMLSNSLFYAKLYLYILIFKVLSILSRSNDQKIHYVKSSGIDKNTANNIQSVARTMKENQINFTDLLNYGNAVNKIGKGKDVFIPEGTQGERGITTDILSGQDVQLNTELMEMLITNAINATGVPSVIMSYINEADYSRTLVMANAKFIGRVVNYQIDFNRSLTELYKKLMKFSLNIDNPAIIDTFSYKLNPPKSMNNTNLSDLTNNAEQTIAYVIKTLIGENRDPEPNDNIKKDLLYKKVAKELMPMLPWNDFEKMLEEVEIDLAKHLQEKRIKVNEDEQ